MDEAIRTELTAMQTAYDAMGSLSASGRRRAVMWLAAKLDIDLSGYDALIVQEALAAAEGRP